MTLAIYEIDVTSKRRLANTPEFASLAEAEAFIYDKFAKILGWYEIDPDVENTADFITTIGGHYVVEAA